MLKPLPILKQEGIGLGELEKVLVCVISPAETCILKFTLFHKFVGELQGNVFAAPNRPPGISPLSKAVTYHIVFVVEVDGSRSAALFEYNRLFIRVYLQDIRA